MRVETRFFDSIIPDNDIIYFNMLFGVIESIDELSSLEVRKLSKCYHFRIAPSTPEYAQPLLKEILTFHNMLGIRLDLSKSIRTSSTIDFEITLN